MPHIIYQGRDVNELEAHAPYGDGECVALVQALTNVGHTSRWRPGLRVVDLAYLNPGTVIANFVFKNGVGRFPNKHGYHAGLFVEFGPRSQSSGRAMSFDEMGQWRNRNPLNTVKKRRLEGYGDSKAYAPADNADSYYVVLVP